MLLSNPRIWSALGSPLYRWPAGTVQDRVERLQNEIQRLFSGITERPARVYPAINIWTTDEEVLVTSELPGINTKDLDITVTGRTLTLKGTRNDDEAKENECYHRRECRYGNFVRAIELPYEVDAVKVNAKLDKGILSVTLQRAEAFKPKKIQISSN